MSFGEYALHALDAENQAEIASSVINHLRRIANALEKRAPEANAAFEESLRELRDREAEVTVVLEPDDEPEHWQREREHTLRGTVFGVHPGALILEVRAPRVVKGADGRYEGTQTVSVTHHLRINAIRRFWETEPPAPGGKTV